ncbi:unnamed protein product [Orchesella dallaii]|uniref:Uncharacterized protein n=1 Tax=Orchesella dallaii TaxID=48710 RepID=A0ABP1QIS3_9HEXA
MSTLLEWISHRPHQPFPSPQQVGAHYHQLLHHDPYLDNSGKGVYANDHHEQHQFPSLIGHSPPSSTLPHSNSNSHLGVGDNYLFNTVDDHHHNDPNVLLYTHSVINSSPVSDIAEAWRVFPHKRRKK